MADTQLLPGAKILTNCYFLQFELRLDYKEHNQLLEYFEKEKGIMTQQQREEFVAAIIPADSDNQVTIVIIATGHIELYEKYKKKFNL
ncbi:hypothetical protein KC866_00120 [Patescibacteria group bacterium]|nr:hypothetical protein [Patescibacteria group bacterium]